MYFKTFNFKNKSKASYQINITFEMVMISFEF